MNGTGAWFPVDELKERIRNMLIHIEHQELNDYTEGFNRFHRHLNRERFFFGIRYRRSPDIGVDEASVRYTKVDRWYWQPHHDYYRQKEICKSVLALCEDVIRSGNIDRKVFVTRKDNEYLGSVQ